MVPVYCLSVVEYLFLVRNDETSLPLYMFERNNVYSVMSNKDVSGQGMF